MFKGAAESVDELNSMEILMLGNEETHEREVSLLERSEWVGDEARDRVGNAGEEDIMDAIFVYFVLFISGVLFQSRFWA